MFTIIKRLLFLFFGLETYLKVLHNSFYFLFDLKLLKYNSTFKYHYFVRNLIEKDDYVLDLGANLGYFAKNFSRLVGPMVK